MKILDHWQQFLRDNPEAADTATLKATPEFKQFLLNRLRRAFDAGVEAGREDVVSAIGAAVKSRLLELTE